MRVALVRLIPRKHGGESKDSLESSLRNEQSVISRRNRNGVESLQDSSMSIQCQRNEPKHASDATGDDQTKVHLLWIFIRRPWSTLFADA